MLSDRHRREKRTERKEPTAQWGRAWPERAGGVHVCAKGARPATHKPRIPFLQEQDVWSGCSLTLGPRDWNALGEQLKSWVPTADCKTQARTRDPAGPGETQDPTQSQPVSPSHVAAQSFNHSTGRACRSHSAVWLVPNRRGLLRSEHCEDSTAPRSLSEITHLCTTRLWKLPRPALVLWAETFSAHCAGTGYLTLSRTCAWWSSYVSDKSTE